MADREENLALLHRVFGGAPSQPVNVFGNQPQVTDEEQRRKLAGMDGNAVTRVLDQAQDKLNSGAQYLDEAIGIPKLWEDPLSGHSGPYLTAQEIDQMPKVGFFEGWAHALPAAVRAELTGRVQTGPPGVASAAFPKAAASLQRLKEEAVFRDAVEGNKLMTREEAQQYAANHEIGSTRLPADDAQVNVANPKGEATFPRVENLGDNKHQGLVGWLRSTPGVGRLIREPPVGLDTNNIPDRTMVPTMQEEAQALQNQHAWNLQNMHYGPEEQGWDDYHLAGGGTWNFPRATGPNGEPVAPNTLGRVLTAMSNNIDKNVRRHEMYGLVTGDNEFRDMGGDYWDHQLGLELDNEAATAGPGSMADESVPLPRPKGWVDEHQRKGLEDFVRRWSMLSPKK